MKKLLYLSVLMAAMAACSKDDDPAPVVPVIVNPCETTVYHLTSGNAPGEPTVYSIQYGTTEATSTWHDVTETTYNFYLARWNAGNKCWIGNQ